MNYLKTSIEVPKVKVDSVIILLTNLSQPSKINPFKYECYNSSSDVSIITKLKRFQDVNFIANFGIWNIANTLFCYIL